MKLWIFKMLFEVTCYVYLHQRFCISLYFQNMLATLPPYLQIKLGIQHTTAQISSMQFYFNSGHFSQIRLKEIYKIPDINFKHPVHLTSHLILYISVKMHCRQLNKEIIYYVKVKISGYRTL